MPAHAGLGSSQQEIEDAASSWAVRFAREESPRDPVDPGRVRVELLTDPWSVWCWGFEPVRRALELRYPSIEFRNLVGGMFEHLPSPEERGFDLDAFFTMVQRTTGMPVTTKGLERDRPSSTYPACIHVHAVRLLDASLEDAYLRALREAAYLDARNVSDREVAGEVAEQVGLEREAFEEAMASGEPEREFRDRMAWLQQHELHAYPTVLLTVGERQARVEGFQNIASLINVIESMSGRLHPAVPPPELDKVLVADQRLATREVAEVLGCSIEAAYERLEGARQKGDVERERHETGDVWRLSG